MSRLGAFSICGLGKRNTVLTKEEFYEWMQRELDREPTPIELNVEYQVYMDWCHECLKG